MLTGSFMYLYIYISSDLLFIRDDIILELPSFKKSNCQVASFPAIFSDFWQATGTVSNRLVACSRGLCWYLNAGKWTSIANMKKARRFAAASNSSDGWMVTGGYNTDGEYNTSEVFVVGNGGSIDDGSWLPGPELPQGLLGHCQVQAENSVYVIGNTNNTIQLYYSK